MAHPDRKGSSGLVGALPPRALGLTPKEEPDGLYGE